MNGTKWLVAAFLAVFSAASVLAAGRGQIDSLASVNRINPGVTTVQQVRDMFGPPARGPMTFRNKGISAIEYEVDDAGFIYVISISYGNDGIVREVVKKRPAGGL